MKDPRSRSMDELIQRLDSFCEYRVAIICAMSSDCGSQLLVIPCMHILVTHFVACLSCLVGHF